MDLSILPPCSCALLQLIRRVNYQKAIWRRANIVVVDAPFAVDGYGWLMAAGYLEALWFDGDVVPQVVVDVDTFLMQTSTLMMLMKVTMVKCIHQ